MQKEKEKVIAGKYLQNRIPIFPTLVLLMFMDYINASQLAYGIVGTIWAIYFIFCIVRLFTHKAVHPKDII